MTIAAFMRRHSKHIYVVTLLSLLLNFYLLSRPGHPIAHASSKTVHSDAIRLPSQAEPAVNAPTVRRNIRRENPLPIENDKAQEAELIHEAKAKKERDPPAIAPEDDDTPAEVDADKAIKSADDKRQNGNDVVGKPVGKEQSKDADGDEEVVAEDDYEDETDNVSTMFRYRNLLNQRKPTFMVAVITGGNKPSTRTNRKAVIDTWFDEHAYMVTREDVPTDRVIRLSELAESGGHRFLPRKVKHMFAYMYENMIDDYDWFVKADDDTYINIPRFQKTLSVFNPDIPVYFGKPFSTKLRGAAGPSPLWQDFTAMSFCHGGSGYIMSRALLKLVGPYIRDAPMTTSLEDAAVASVLYEHTGVRCINVNANMFGGLDLVGNSHDQELIMKRVQNYEKVSPKTLKKTATIHSVQANVTHYLHGMYSKLNQNTALEASVDELAERDLELRRWLMVTSWNCTVEPALADQAPYKALCQQTALLSYPDTSPSMPQGFEKPVWRVAATADKLCQADSSADPGAPVSWLRMQDQTARDAMPAPKAIASSISASGPGNAVLVPVDEISTESKDAIVLLVRSLRATGSTADVVVLSSQPQALQSELADYCGVQLVETDPTRLTSQFAKLTSFKPSPDLIAYLAMADYLNTESKRFDQLLIVAADTYFQRDPFTALPKRGGLQLYIDDPVTTDKAPSCFSGNLRIHELPAYVSLKVVYGSAQAVRDYLAVSSKVYYRMKRCPYETVVMLNVYRKDYAVHQPIALFTPWDGPVTFVTDQQMPQLRKTDDGALLAINLRDTVTTIVTGYLSRCEAARDQLVMPSPEATKSTLDIILGQTTSKLHATIRYLNTYAEPTAAEWRPDSKAYLKWSALGGGMTSRSTPLLAFKPLWEIFAKHSQYTSDPDRAVVTRVSTPGTHKTGAVTLAGILYRYASRQHLRVFHRGAWPFLGTEVIKNPDKSWQDKYDIVFSQITARGQWFGGDYDTAKKFYKHLLGDNHRSLLITAEPSQHYIDWLYFYVIPKKRKFKPIQVLQQFVRAKMNRNMFMQEFSVRSFDQFDAFMSQHFPSFDIVLIRDRLDECLVLMRRLFNWDIRDITYLRPAVGGKRFDGKPLARPPRVAELEGKLQQDLRSMLKLDYRLYEAANKRLDELIAAQGPDFKAELTAFQSIQGVLGDLCNRHSNHPTCKWYSLTEYDFFGMLGPDGYSKAVPLY